MQHRFPRTQTLCDNPSTTYGFTCPHPREGSTKSVFSRRSFLGGLLGTLAAWLGGKARATPAPPAALPAAPVPAQQTWCYSCDGLGTVTTFSYDARGNLVSCPDSPYVGTYTYDCLRGNFPADPPAS
jgi:hypothetical protein